MDDILQKSKEAAIFLKVLANPNRLAVLCCLSEGHRNVTELTQLINLPQAAMSNQLAVLREAGLVDCEIHHRERRYYINDKKSEEVIKLLHRLFCEN
ncbi:ArsR/SmtB family transcription factor [Caviibacterium pharyngocola]|uniref:ArsR family transcriptional regulator n=1 Tax=Caviibacterium pharyngocola TaxID=28159 RepID=A0A2M8RSX3_9PAST|nr:metalloregulator ArsR/SmtB family transcription factor [Caviibacterium pharyngocola]PJG81983.1 ArsR family transcriptional regulator [Caviibacterium pharyngocola]